MPLTLQLLRRAFWHRRRGVAATGAGSQALDTFPWAEDFLDHTLDGKFKLEEVLGRGGMGVVYRGTEKCSGRRVALKMLSPEVGTDTELAARFRNEAKASEGLDSDYVVRVDASGIAPEGAPYYVMELLEGQPLNRYLAQHGPLGEAQCVDFALQLSLGFAVAHQAGVVHRDVKPENIFIITDGSGAERVKILDFGLAKLRAGSTDYVTQAGVLFGTPLYMSPEQAIGSPVDERTDIYALGVVLYKMLTGRVPFGGSSHRDVMHQHVNDRPPRPTLFGIRVSSELEAVLFKCMRKRPEDRFSSMLEMNAALRAVRELHEPNPDSSTSEGSNVRRATAAPTKRHRGPPPVFWLGLSIGVCAPIAAFLIWRFTSGAAAVEAPPAKSTVTLSVGGEQR